MAAEYTYTDLQVRVLDRDPNVEEAGLAAVTVQNTGDEDGVATVRWFVASEALAPLEIASSEETLEVGHSHRVRVTLTGAQLSQADAPAELLVGSDVDNIKARTSIG